MKSFIHNLLYPKTSRLPWIDYARGIAILLVLYRHAFEGIKRAGVSVSDYHYMEIANIMSFGFRMPLFFIISGVFAGITLAKYGIKEFIHKKYKLILYPYLLWAAIQITVQLFFSDYVNAKRSLYDYLYILYSPQELEQFWYLYALFSITALYALLKVKLKIKPLVNLALGFSFYLISAYFTNQRIDTFFLHDIMHYYLFFAIGDVVSDFLRNRNNYRFFSSWGFFAILLPLFAIVQVFFLNANLSHNSHVYVQETLFLQYIAVAAVGSAFMLNLSFLLQRYNKAVWLQTIGSYSLYIFIMHVTITAACRILFVNLLHIESVPVIVFSAMTMGIILPVFFYRLCMQAGAWWLFSPERPATATQQQVPVKKVPATYALADKVA